MNRESKSLEVSCYICGLGAFGIFLRWMQLQLAYNEDGLVDKSVFNVLIVLAVAATYYVANRFIKGFRSGNLCLSENFYIALKNNGKLYTLMRRVIGGLMVLASAYLYFSCEVSPDAKFLKVLAITGVFTGIAFPWLLACANKPHASNPKFIAFLSAIPIIMFCVWILTCYKENSINPVTWDYVLEIATLIVCIIAFYRVAGYAFMAPNEWKSMRFCMLGAMLCLSTLSDKRLMAEQLMFAAAALMLLMFNWIMIDNLDEAEETPSVMNKNGFDTLR